MIRRSYPHTPLTRAERERKAREQAERQRTCPHDEADRLIEMTENNVYVTCRACGAVLQA